MPRPKGEVWKYFQELPEHQNGSLVQCSECGVRITRGSAEASRGSLNTSSMTDHLRRNHSEVLEKIENRKAEKLARFYLTLTPPPTSTFVERLFSQAGTRNTLLPETLERMMFLRSNMVAANFEMEYWGELESDPQVRYNISTGPVPWLTWIYYYSSLTFWRNWCWMLMLESGREGRRLGLCWCWFWYLFFVFVICLPASALSQ